MKMKSKVDLPEDLIVEILSRVPATSLVRFRSISKRWNALIKDGRFTKKHSANAPRPSLVIMLKNLHLSLVRVGHGNIAPSVHLTSHFSLKDPLSNSSKEVDIRQVFHCDGLLLCVTKDNRLVVWNPCSGETRWIQPRNSYGICDEYAIGKSSCNKYKILRINHFYNASLECKYEVYDFSSKSWRRVAETRDWFMPPYGKLCGVFLKGHNYWFCFTGPEQYECFLLSFDFSKESFQSQPIPYNCHLRYPASALSVVREEQLCLLTHRAKNTMDVWMGSKVDLSSGVMSWSKFLTVKLTSKVFSCGMSFFADEQNKVVVCCNNIKGEDNVLHIMGEDRHITVDYGGAETCYCSSGFISYVPTLVQIQ